MKTILLWVKWIWCLIAGHDRTEASVDVRPTYRFSEYMDPPTPNYGFAEVCRRCHKQLTETKWECDD